MFQKPDFLTGYEFDVLRLHNEGVKVKNIASQLSKKEGNIRKTKVVVRKKIEKELQKTARSLRIDLDISNMPKDAGLLIGFDWIHNTKVFLIFTFTQGIIAWYDHECKTEECLKRNRETLDLICHERKIELTIDEQKLSIREQFLRVIEIIQSKKE
ncbi:MAG: hypothetical protein ACW964_01580 [Candidatus Hodarchaeales archaeon]|jgi:hypothetical protein